VAWLQAALLQIHGPAGVLQAAAPALLAGCCQGCPSPDPRPCCPLCLLPLQDHPDFRQAASLLEEVDDRVVKQGLVGLGVGAGLAAVVGLGLGLLLGGGRRH
jgi:hypothetical protein